MTLSETYAMQQLLSDLPQTGKVEWIGVRPGRRETMLEPEAIEVRTDVGIVGDRYAGKSGKRQVTLIQFEHLSAIAGFLGIEKVLPNSLRRNIAISGINLLALKNNQFSIGSAVLEYTGLCHPCSAMQRQFGAGGYNAVRGHGGITAMVVESGVIRLGNPLQAMT
ncbi:MAG: MOSC domain-containing protein [Acidiferrobacterales bacterium]|nr:MOSC domain-containing protein [Acidiferrobacterales bacterium]